MCLIVGKPKGTPFPSKRKMKLWCHRYPHGVGVAFVESDHVRVIKGAMTWKDLREMLRSVTQVVSPKSTTDIDMVIQFRQAVTGKPCPRFCHPFPVSSKQEDLDALDVSAPAALAHNGTIYEYCNSSYCSTSEKTKEINDAQEFIKDYVVPLGEQIFNPIVQKLIVKTTYSKFAILTPKGITYLGNFIEEDGYWYSNDGYKRTPITSSVQGYAGQAFNGYSGWEAEDATEVGIVCDNCHEVKSPVYELAGDGCLLCHGCFVHFMGRKPTQEERVL